MLPMELWDNELPSLVLLFVYSLTLCYRRAAQVFLSMAVVMLSPLARWYYYRTVSAALIVAPSEEVTSPPSHSILGEDNNVPWRYVGAALGPNPCLPIQGYSFLSSNVHALTSFPLSHSSLPALQHAPGFQLPWPKTGRPIRLANRVEC